MQNGSPSPQIVDEAPQPLKDGIRFDAAQSVVFLEHNRQLLRHQTQCCGVRCDRSDTDLASMPRITIGHRHRAVLVPRVHDAHAVLLRHDRAPVHIGIAQQGK